MKRFMGQFGRAIACIALYGALYAASGSVASLLNVAPADLQGPAVLAFTLALCLLLWRTGWFHARGGIDARTAAPVAAVALALAAAPLLRIATSPTDLGNSALSLLALTMCGAVLEELFFRRFLIDWLSDSCCLTRFQAVLASAALFAVLHLANGFPDGVPAAATHALYAFATGICFGWMYLKTRRIWPCMIIHAIINVAAVSSSGIISPNVDLALSILVSTVLIVLWLFRGTATR